MKKITILSIIAASILMVGCGEDSKKTVTEASTKAVESTQEAAGTVAETAKRAADIAVEKAKEAEVVAKKMAEDAVTTAKEMVKKAEKVTVLDEVSTAKGKEIYAKCTGCHGIDGKTKALGKSPVIAGQNKAEIITKLKAYKDGTRNENGMGKLMQGQITSLDEEALIAVSEYIETLK